MTSYHYHIESFDIAIAEYDKQTFTISVDGKIVYTEGTIPAPPISYTNLPDAKDHPNITFTPLV